MKVSMNWLKDLVDIDVSVEKLSNLYNLHSAEVEEYYKLVDASNVVVGYVKEKEKHPNADKLSVCQVDIGGEVTQIVCGAPNVAAGQKVIVSLPGATLSGGFTIKKSTIRDVESNGMICSLSELGIDKKYHNEEGIHVITTECKPGDNAIEALFLNDEVMVLDLTPNRADLLSVMGVAYDAAAILNKTVHLRDITVEEVAEEINCNITLDTEHCSAYYARVIKDIVIKDSPKWMQSRLIAAGMRPINNIVDITNYVMLETGQPLHAFDYDLLGTNEIKVRMANPGETIQTLDDKERKLSEDDIVITNGTKAVALGGVMGGLETEIVAASKTVLLESAIFDPYHIRKTSNRLDLRSEASTRFERKVDPNRTELALELASHLFSKYASGNVLKGISKVDNSDKSEKKITLTLSKLNKVLGSNYSIDLIQDTLNRLAFKNTLSDEEFTIYAPTRRQDIETYQDIVEEIGRIIGYDKLPLTLPETVSQGSLSEYQEYKRKLKRLLAGQGLNEIVTYALVSEDKVFDFVKEETEIVKLLMPMSGDRSVMAKTPITGLIDAIKYNIARKVSDVSIFEIGKLYNKDKEIELLAGALTGELSSTLWQGKKEIVDFYTVKGILEAMFRETGLSHLTFEPTKQYKNLHPGQQAVIRDYSGEIGFIGKIHPQYAKENGLKDVYLFELNIEKMYDVRRVFKKVKEINKFPSMYRDLALVVDYKISAKEILDIIEKTGKRMLTDAYVFDLYVGENVEQDKKSLAIRLEFSDAKKTLETKEVDERVESILNELKIKLDAELR
jgi:phenylalanyl-tRNA synthetase beta chain